jgi:hypothetical protein
LHISTKGKEGKNRTCRCKVVLRIIRDVELFVTYFKLSYEVSDSDGGECEDGCVLVCCPVLTLRTAASTFFEGL